MNIQETLRNLRDESPQIKLKALKEISELTDFSSFPVNTLIELSQALGELREYFNPNVQMLATRNYDRVSQVITDLMKKSPESVARNVATSLVLDDDEDEPKGKPARSGPTETAVPGTELPPRREAGQPARPPQRPAAAPADSGPKPDTASSGAAVAAERPAPRPAAKPRPQLLIVHADGEGRMAKIWNTLVGLLFSALTLLVAWKQIGRGDDAGYAALALAGIFVAFLFVPSRMVPSTNKARFAMAGFVCLTAWILHQHGLQHGYGLLEHVPKEFHDLAPVKHLDATITKFIILLWFLVPTYMIIVDDAPAGGTKFFVFLFTVYGSASIVESLMQHGTVDALVGEQGFFRIIPFPYIRPFYFAVNVLVPVHLVVGAFILLRELFALSFRRMVGAALLIAASAAAGTSLFLNLRHSPYPNLADFIFPRTLEAYSGNLMKGVHTLIVDRGNVESRIQDALAFERGVIFRGDSPTGEVALEPQVMLPEGAADPSLSANGLYLVFTQPDGKRADIKFMRVQTREVVPLVSDNAKNREPVFSPDASRIAYISDADGQDNIWIIGTNKQGLKQVTQSTGAKRSLTWAGDWIAYESNGAVIRYPVPRDPAAKSGTVKSRLPVYNKIASDLLDTSVVANLTLDGGRVTISFRTSEANEAAIFRQIYMALVCASKVFAGHEAQIASYEVKASYLSHELSVSTIPDIVRINLVDFAYLSEEKIRIWLKTSEIARNGQPYLKPE